MITDDHINEAFHKLPTGRSPNYAHSLPLLPTTCNFVLDLETLGTRPNSAVLQIGLTCIETKQTLGIQIGEAIASSHPYFQVDSATYAWWLKQDDAVRAEVFATGIDYGSALSAMTSWVQEQAAATTVPLKDAIVWANDPEFDCVILKNACYYYSIDFPFNFRNHRSFRTLHGVYEEHCGYDVWSSNAAEHWTAAIEGKYNLDTTPATGWTPVKHTAHGDSVLEAMAIVAMQNMVHKRGCLMNTLREAYSGWKLELVK